MVASRSRARLTETRADPATDRRGSLWWGYCVLSESRESAQRATECGPIGPLPSDSAGSCSNVRPSRRTKTVRERGGVRASFFEYIRKPIYRIG